MWGWIIPVVLLAVGFGLCAITPDKTIIHCFSDGSRAYEEQSGNPLGFLLIIVGVIWLIVKIYRLCRDVVWPFLVDVWYWLGDMVSVGWEYVCNFL